jgi:hypothetical protein
MSEKLQTGEQKSNPRRIRSLGNVVINLGYATTDELFVLRERLGIAQGNLDNDTAILDAAIEDRFDPEGHWKTSPAEHWKIEAPTEELDLPEIKWSDEELRDFGENAA